MPLRPIDIQLAQYLGRIAGETCSEVLQMVALVNNRLGAGDICLDLNRYAEFVAGLQEENNSFSITSSSKTAHTALLQSPLIGAPGQNTPLIFERGRLYLERYWQFEQTLASLLALRIGSWSQDLDYELLAAGLNRLFPPQDKNIDWQRVAAAIAVLRPFCVISGGPGTGKTHTVTAILALVVEQALAHTPERLPRIALGVPTGKAAARLTQSIRDRKEKLQLAPQVAAALPTEAQTLHRLLGVKPGTGQPAYHSNTQLPLDILVVDEASMLDLPMMARLLQALPTKARLIMLGDKHQLASVEAGAVFSDLCGQRTQWGYAADLCAKLQRVANVSLPDVGTTPPAMAGHQVVLQDSHRFKIDSGIGKLAAMVNRGDAAGVNACFTSGQYSDIALMSGNLTELAALLQQLFLPVYRQILDAPTPTAALQTFNQLRVLCAVREGQFGVTAINKLVEAILAQAGLIKPGTAMYAGRPVLVTANDYTQRLYNGDVGLLLPDPAAAPSSTLRAFFDTQDGVKSVPPARIPAHETVYAMTVHKSQGSEFDEVLLILPQTRSQVVTRELVYTGLTRAKQRVIVAATLERMAAAIELVSLRASGLLEQLWTTADKS